MVRFLGKASKKAGLPPGTIIHVGEPMTANVKITIIAYDEERVEEKEVATPEECFPFVDKWPVTWINVDGIHDAEIVQKIGERFDLHPLLLEDVVNTHQRPKLEDFEKYLFIVLKMLMEDEENNNEIRAEQVSLILGHNFVLSFQERVGDVFDPIRERIRSGKGRIRKLGADYLAYSLIDAVVDNYFAILEGLGEEIEDLEEELVSDPGRETMHAIHEMKRQMIFLRRSVWPMRELVSGLEHGESPLIQKTTEVYLRDVYDHTIRVIDTIESYRDMVSGMLDIYLSSISNRMNEVMKVLTIIATIFIPITFLVGVYGMNFEYMPELKCRWAYPVVWLVMIAVTVAMLIYFRRKRWI